MLTTTNYTIANKTILNCLLEKVKRKEDVLEFCNQLEKIMSLLPLRNHLASIISELRKGLLMHVVLAHMHYCFISKLHAYEESDVTIIIYLSYVACTSQPAVGTEENPPEKICVNKGT